MNEASEPLSLQQWIGPRAEYRTMLPVSSPRLRMGIGAFALVAGGAVSWFGQGPDDVVGGAAFWFAGLAVFGLAMVLSGVFQLRHEARTRAAVERARGEWPALCDAAREATDGGQGIARMLQQRGYRDYFLRRSIATSLEQELDGTAEQLRADREQRRAAQDTRPTSEERRRFGRMPLLARAPDRCPDCGVPIEITQRERRSLGLGFEGRVLSALAVPTGVLVAVGMAMLNCLPWIAGHAIFGVAFVVAAVIYKAAGTAQKTWQIRCRACPWHAEVVHPERPRAQRSRA